MGGWGRLVIVAAAAVAVAGVVVLVVVVVVVVVVIINADKLEGKALHWASLTKLIRCK